jgi:uncharacterized membrane protein
MESLGLLVFLAFCFVIIVLALVRANKMSQAAEALVAQVDRVASVDARLVAMDRKLDKLLAGAASLSAPSVPAATTPPAGAPSVASPPRVAPPAPVVTPPAPAPTPMPPAHTASGPAGVPPAGAHTPPTPPAFAGPTFGIPQGVLPGSAPHTTTGSSVPGAPASSRPSEKAVSAQASVHSGPSFTSPLTAKSSRPSIATSGSDVEEMIAGHWLNYVGILALAVATAFFLKYAFDNNWIGPSGRVAIGVSIGTALFVVSYWLLRRGYTYFSEGIAGLGSAVLYLSIWSGWHYYHLFPQNTAFVLMILITAAIFGVAITRDSERIALLALIGGLLTPILVSTGRNEETALFSYVTVLGAGVLWIAFQRKWQTLPPIQFLATLGYFWGWYSDFYSARQLENTVFFATVFFILFAALPMVRSLRGEKFSQVEIMIAIGNATQYLVALRWMMWPAQRWNLTAVLVVLAVVHFVVAQGVPRRDAEVARVAKTLYNALALAFATLAVPIGLDNEWITVAWAVEGALLIWCGLKFRWLWLRMLGFALFGVVGVRLLAYPILATATLLLNARFLTQSLCAAAFLAAFLCARDSDEELSDEEAKTYYLLAIIANFLFLVTLSEEVWNFYGRTALVADRALGQQLALSVLWVAYALALMVLGVRLKSASLRWQALALLGVAIAKVFFFDLSFLTRFYRIVSFFVLGLVLLLVSFFYQRRSTTRKT